MAVEEGQRLPPSETRDAAPRVAQASSSVELPVNAASENIANIKKPMIDSRLKDTAAKVPHAHPNQVIPAIRDTLRVQGRPRLLHQLGRLLLPSRATPPPEHVALTSEPPRIRRAVAIGVHGYFPAQILRKVLGPPTGTSVRFANMAAEAIACWARDHGCQCEVATIPLEGEGRIAERVQVLWTALLSHIDEIRNADLVLVACHSQGVPVATMLVSKLLGLGPGCVPEASRVGICAMAGVSMGPFAEYRSRLIGGAAGELFEFVNPRSRVSREYMAAVEHVLGAGCRVTYVGSYDDQLVPLESSVFASISHPYIYRAVFVNGRVHAPNFLSNLLGFIMKLRNLGIPDHGLIRELSSPVAGSLYSGEGHSKLYDDVAVYRLAVDFALESLPVAQPRFRARHPGTTAGAADLAAPASSSSSSPPSSTPGSPTSSNPYILPFIMRGVLEEEYVRHQLAEETAELLRSFDAWKPSSKVLKDVKFRLEGIRSKL
ncbi:hypothetical protein KEM52_005286 [Ascosphaera acerosa]|nr:hypothetical protein KEM52_005286 [Ascosphaera acerosa]